MNDFPIDDRTFVATSAVAAASCLIDPVGAELRVPEDTRTAPLMHEVVLTVNGVDHALKGRHSDDGA